MEKYFYQYQPMIKSQEMRYSTCSHIIASTCAFVLFLRRGQRRLPQPFAPTNSDTIDDDDIILQDGIGLLDVAMPGPPDPVDAREQDGGADDQTAPIHVVDGGGGDGHVQRAQVHDDDEQRPADGDDVDEVPPAAEVEVWSRGENASAADQDDEDRD